MVVYEGEPGEARYEEHAALCRKVPGGVFRHGKVARTLFGNELKYYSEWEFPDLDAFKAASATDEFRATGTDAAEMGIPHSAYLVNVD
jgi:hypothetical protein